MLEAQASLATTIGVVLTDAILSKAQASKLAAVAHDGMARAIRPIHSMVDGDTVFCLASSRRPVAEDPMRSLFAFNTLLGRGRRRLCRRLPRRDACCERTRFLEELHRAGTLRGSAEISV